MRQDYRNCVIHL